MGNHVKKRRKQLKLTQEKVAQAAGTTKATIMKLEKGSMQLTENWLKRLSVPLQCRPEDLIAEEMPQDVPLIGEVREKGELSLYKAMPPVGAGEPDSAYWEGLERVERPPEGGYRAVRAVRVTGEAFEPFLPDGSLIYYAEPAETDIDRFLNQLVVCELEDGRLMIRRLLHGVNFGRYDLSSPNAGTISNVALRWCAKVIFMKPQ